MIDINKVASVYSGEKGYCCCGCAGKHTYASQHRQWASDNRGYLVKDEEINDSVVKRIVNKIEKNNPQIYRNMITAVIGKKLYVAYFKDTTIPSCT